MTRYPSSVLRLAGLSLAICLGLPFSLLGGGEAGATAAPTIGVLGAPADQCATARKSDALFSFDVNWSSVLWSLPPHSGKEKYRYGQLDLHYSTSRGDSYVARVKDSDSGAYWYRVESNKVVDAIGPRPASEDDRYRAKYFGPRASYAHVEWWTVPSAAGFMYEKCTNAVAGPASVLSQQPSKRRSTVIRLVFDSCPGCTVRAVNARMDDPLKPRFWKAAVRGGVAQIGVPTSATAGMAFEVVSEPWYGAWPGGNAVPVLAIGFEGVSTGSTVGRDTAMREGQRANWCWAGTDKSRVTIRVRSVRDTFPTKYSDESPRQAVYWTAPTLRTFNDAANMRSDMGTQEIPYC